MFIFVFAFVYLLSIDKEIIYVVADVPTTGHAIDLVLIQDNPKPLNLRSVDGYKLISWIL